MCAMALLLLRRSCERHSWERCNWCCLVDIHCSDHCDNKQSNGRQARLVWAARHDDPFPSAYTLWVSVLMLRMGSDDNHGMFIGQCCSHDTVECIAITLHTAESSRMSNTRQAQHDWWDQDDRLAM